MTNLYFYDFAELGNYLYETAIGGKSVSAVLFYDETIDMMKWLLEYEDIEVGNIQIKQEYSREYYVTLNEDLILNINPVFDNDGIIVSNEVDNILFVDDVLSAISRFNTDSEQYKIVIGKEDDVCNSCCLDCSYCPHREVSEALSVALDFVDYVINHFDD